MSITSIQRDWGIGPSIVRMLSNDNYATITAANYILQQMPNIVIANGGPFNFLPNDILACSFTGGKNFFTLDATYSTMTAIEQGNSDVSSITGTANQITVVSTGPGGTGNVTLSLANPSLTWVSQTTGSVTANINTGYIITDASTVTITLPVTAPLGSVISIRGQGAGGWILVPGAGQTIKIITGSAATSVASAERYDSIDLTSVVANTTWEASSMATTGFVYS